MRNALLLLFALAALCLCSCVMQTHERMLDMAKEYEAIVELPDVVYRKGGRFFELGVRTTVRRSERRLIDVPMLDGALGGPAGDKTGIYTMVPGSTHQLVYREFSLRYGAKPFAVSTYAHSSSSVGNTPPPDDAPAWSQGSVYKNMGWHPYYNKKGEITSWFQYNIEDLHLREKKGKWLDKLPTGAHPALHTDEQIKNHPVLRGETGAGWYYLSDLSEERVDKSRALYAYPLAAVCWLVPDAPFTIATHLLATPIFLWDFVLRIP